MSLYFYYATSKLLHNVLFNTFPISYYNISKLLTDFIPTTVNVIHGVKYSKRTDLGNKLYNGKKTTELFSWLATLAWPDSCSVVDHMHILEIQDLSNF